MSLINTTISGEILSETDSSINAESQNMVDAQLNVDIASPISTSLNADMYGNIPSKVKGVKGNAETNYRDGYVNLTPENLGLGNVDNTSDLNKPISTATQNALNNKVDKVTGKGLSTNDFTNADKSNLDANTSARHTHSNKALLDTYTQTEVNLADAVSKKHTHSNKALLDTYNQSNSDITDSVNKKHSHSNKALLDTYTQTEANLSDAVSKKHTHSNKSVLDNTTASFTDNNYVHTDNNFTTAYKNKIDANESAISAEVTNRTNADTAIDNKLNNSVVTDFSYVAGATNVKTTKSTKNLKTGTSSTSELTIPLASDSQAGIMSKEDYAQIRSNTSRIEALEGQTVRLLYTAKSNPTPSEISQFVISSGYTEGAGVAVVVSATYHIWHYYENETPHWKDDGVDTVTQFTNTSLGTIKGSTDDGKVYAENDGTGSINGWDTLKDRVTAVEGALPDTSGLVPKTTTIAGIDLQDNITSQELGSALGVPSTYIKNASVSGTQLTLTKQDDTTIQFTGGGGEKSVAERIADAITRHPAFNGVYLSTLNGATKSDYSDYITALRQVWNNPTSAEDRYVPYSANAMALMIHSGTNPYYNFTFVIVETNQRVKLNTQSTTMLLDLQPLFVDFTHSDEFELINQSTSQYSYENVLRIKKAIPKITTLCTDDFVGNLEHSGVLEVSTDEPIMYNLSDLGWTTMDTLNTNGSYVSFAYTDTQTGNVYYCMGMGVKYNNNDVIVLASSVVIERGIHFVIDGDGDIAVYYPD